MHPTAPFRRPRHIVTSKKVETLLTDTIKRAKRIFRDKGVELPSRHVLEFVPVNHVRGRANWVVYEDGESYFQVLIPHHAFQLKSDDDRPHDYLLYYVLHELCHVAAIHQGILTRGHHADFYRIFGQVSPKRFHHHERDYHPKLFAALCEQTS